MRIVFVHTPVTASAIQPRRIFWQNFDIRYHAVHAGLRHMKAPMWELPHWMHWLGGVLVEAGYTDLGVLDLYTRPLILTMEGQISEHEIVSAINSEPADVYLFSPMTANLARALEIARHVKAVYPAAVTVFGGVVATPLADEVALNPQVDFVVEGRGERALPELIRSLKGERTVESVSGLVFKSLADTQLRRTLPSSPVPIAEIPFPKIDLFPPSTGDNLRYIRQVFALGCPYKCTFCTIQTIGRRPEYFPVDRVIQEIQAYKERYGVHHNVYFGDETFTLNPTMTMKLLSALRSEGGIAYDCQTRLNCLSDSRLLKAMNESGCKWIEIGLETGVQDTLNRNKRGTKLTATEEILKRLRDFGLPTCSFLINGFPDQSIDDMRRSIDWICDLIGRGLLHASYIFGLVPYPGSAMFERPDQFGMVLEHNNFEFYHEDLAPVYHTTMATSDQIYEVFLEGIRNIADVMGETPYLGQAPRAALEEYGQFWDGAHA